MYHSYLGYYLRLRWHQTIEAPPNNPTDDITESTQHTDLEIPITGATWLSVHLLHEMNDNMPTYMHDCTYIVVARL